MPVPDSITQELLDLNQRLLESIAKADWDAYQELCDPSLTAFEPEAMGQLVNGLDFHRFYFDLGGVKGRHHTTMCAPAFASWETSRWSRIRAWSSASAPTEHP